MTKLKEILIYIFTLGGLAAFIYAALTKNDELRRKLLEQKAKARLNKAVNAKEKAEALAITKEEEFNAAFDDYITTRSNTHKRDS